jgi:hypothetical protein
MLAHLEFFVEGVFCFFIIVEIQVAPNWAFTHRLAIGYMAYCVATTGSFAFLALFSSLSLCFVLLCSFVIALSITFFLQDPQRTQ